VPELILTPQFERAFKRLVRKDPALRTRIEQTLGRMAADLTDRRLKTHHLSGQLAGLHACSVAHDCRIVFARQKKGKAEAEVLLLINIGSHEEVY
jgi:addiction module RelE/StbE family toxin